MKILEQKSGMAPVGFYNVKPIPTFRKNLEVGRGQEGWNLLPHSQADSPSITPSLSPCLPYFPLLVGSAPLPEEGITPILTGNPKPKGPRGLRYQSEAHWDVFPTFINIPEHLGHEAWESSPIGDHLGQTSNGTDWETQTPEREQSVLGPTENPGSPGRAPIPALRELPTCVGP